MDVVGFRWAAYCFFVIFVLLTPASKNPKEQAHACMYVFMHVWETMVEKRLILDTPYA